ncbi:MAG: alpha-amylase family protein [Limisphaerales bacterium]
MSEILNRRTFIQKAALYAGSLASLHRVSAAPTLAPAARSRTEGLVAFRISAEQWLTDDRFRGLLAFLRKYPGTADELAFFTSSTHPPLPLVVARQRAERLASLMPLARREGMAAGINLLATMGHHEENLEGSLDEPWQRVVDPHGQISRGSYCPMGEEFLDYVAKVYAALAEAAPDFLWIDDDVRLAGHMPVGYTCFCDRCMQRFARQTGRDFTRETLVAAFNSGSWEERLALRRRWLDHNRATIDELFRLIERTVHRVKPGLPLGFMTGDRFYEGYDFATWAGTLAGPDHGAVRWRPGGGFYSDESLAGLVGKAHDIGRQVSQLPPEVKIIQSEIENFPYDLLRKSVETTVVEAAVHIAAGATGAAFNVLSQRPDPLDEYEPMLRRIHRAKPFYAMLRQELGRSLLAGVWPAWNRDTFAANNLDGTWPEGAADATGALGQTYVLGEIGIPVCYGPGGAVVNVLAGPGPLAFSREELKRFFSGGVLMDLRAWHALDRLGLAGWTGVRPGRSYSRDAIEVLADHPLNGRFKSWSRDGRQSFWHEVAGTLEPLSTAVETLARLSDYSGRDLGISMTAFANDLGGRVVVMGYFPWSQMHHLAKSSQMKAVCAWLSQDRLPVVLDSFARVHLWVREPAPGRLACVLLNASLDPAPGVTLRFAKRFREFHWLNMDGDSVSLKPAGATGTHPCRVKVPLLKPWSVSLLTGKA